MRSVVVGRRFAVGDPTGTTAPIVMVGAHIDSVLGAPGAHDDASGNGVSMEIARVSPSCRSTRRSGSAASAARRTA